jgi:hypothetical protein
MRRDCIVSPIGTVLKDSLVSADTSLNPNGVFWVKVSFEGNYKQLLETLSGEFFRVTQTYTQVNKLYIREDDKLIINFKSKDKPRVTDLDNKPYRNIMAGDRVQVAFVLKEYSDPRIGSGLSPRIKAILVHVSQQEIEL